MTPADTLRQAADLLDQGIGDPITTDYQRGYRTALTDLRRLAAQADVRTCLVDGCDRLALIDPDFCATHVRQAAR